MKPADRRYGDAREGRTPHGVRGLKLAGPGVWAESFASHPSRGAWIETWPKRVVWMRGRVAPLTGCVD